MIETCRYDKVSSDLTPSMSQKVVQYAKEQGVLG